MSLDFLELEGISTTEGVLGVSLPRLVTNTAPSPGTVAGRTATSSGFRNITLTFEPQWRTSITFSKGWSLLRVFGKSYSVP